ncbi:MAG: hypothetical protein ACRD01_02770 [Terriglobales bacterium]
MATVITINRADVVALIEHAAARFTQGNKTAVIEMAVKRLLSVEPRSGALFGRHPGSVKIMRGVDLTAPTFEHEPTDAERTRWAADLPRE